MAKGTEKQCAGCGGTFRSGTNLRCTTCRTTDRECGTCGILFRGRDRHGCGCKSRVRACITCGLAFRTTFYLECGACSGRTDAANHRRRALRIAAEVAGPLPRVVYVRVAASGPCVYCGDPATTVDHIRPLVRGGH